MARFHVHDRDNVSFNTHFLISSRYSRSLVLVVQTLYLRVHMRTVSAILEEEVADVLTSLFSTWKAT